jgi:hypothetical protein
LFEEVIMLVECSDVHYSKEFAIASVIVTAAYSSDGFYYCICNKIIIVENYQVSVVNLKEYTTLEYGL